MRIDCVEPFGLWRVGYSGPAQDIADAAILLERSKLRPEGWYRDARLEMTVDFRALTEPHYAATGSRGHFEQTGEVRGVDHDRRTHHACVAGYGVRDKSWGPRDWGAAAPAQGTGARRNRQDRRRSSTGSR